MDINDVEAIEVSGLVIRTTNEAEMNAESAKIGKVWEDFYTRVLPQTSERSKIYGVYTNYESDFTGEFDVFACASNVPPSQSDGLTQTTIQKGKYLTFSRKGPMPQAVIELWEEVWSYFDSINCPYSRSYTTDFEYYKSENEVEISIAVESLD